MTIEQIVEIPANHRLTIEVPRDIPAGRTILAFTPALVGEDDYVCPHCGKKEHIPNAETIAAMEEGDAMERGEIPVTWYNSLDEMWEALHK
ncbi:hypothetical protein AGMMS49546_05530 [Spirochaetia bacterium]|nr:hypothetical protein AGMMS49546_05530 [Spirochaetia bacterium]